MEKTHLEKSVEGDYPISAIARWEWFAWAILLIWLIASRVWYAPDVLYEWDSANYALGLREFNIFEHQPHPPGNPLLMMLLWMAQPFGAGPPQFLVVNALLGGGVLLLLGWMTRPLVGPVSAFVVAVAFAFCPPFWYQGAVSTAYIAECFTLAACGAVSLALIRGKLSLPIGALFAALALGLRPSAVPAVVLIIIYGIAFSEPKLRPFILSGVVFILTCLTWTIPMLFTGGGLPAYRKASGALWEWQIELGSILGDGSIVYDNTTLITRYLLDGVNVLWLAIIINAIIAAARWRLPLRTLAFVTVWVLPGALLYALHHLAKSAYVLTLMPACYVLFILLVGAANHELKGWPKRVVGGLNVLLFAMYLALNGLAFFTAIPASLLKYDDAPVELPDPMIMTGDYGRLALEYRTWPHRRTTEIMDALHDGGDLALFLFGTHELMRLQMAASPEQWMVASSADHGIAFDTQGIASPQSFGEYQTQVLLRPELGLSLDQVTKLDLDSGRLRISRLGRIIEFEGDRVPRRLIVFTQCPPCRVETGARFEEIRTFRVSSSIIAIELSIVE